jgi:hypothetical protein
VEIKNDLVTSFCFQLNLNSGCNPKTSFTAKKILKGIFSRKCFEGNFLIQSYFTSKIFFNEKFRLGYNRLG